MKTRYVLEQTGGRNILFATGTPISNSMAEMYTMQRYRSFADVITNDDIKEQLAARGEKLPLPRVKGGKPENMVVERSDDQAAYIDDLVYRSENLPKKPGKDDDNMLKIMSDARKAALDMRLIDPSLPDYEGSKVNRAADNIKRIHDQWHDEKDTQLVFIDLSTPQKARAKEQIRLQDLVARAEKGDDAAQMALDKMSDDEIDALVSSFSVYDDLKDKLISRGIPEKEIAFIHDANTDIQKEELFGKVRSGAIRVLFGSTPKMGAGTNVQNRLVALHHLDAPWRPSDLEQRDGRGIRQGNELYNADPNGFEIEIVRYATKNTLDARQWQTIEAKARFVQQIRKGDLKIREIEDIGGEAANAAEMKAAASGNPLILEEMDLSKQLRRLTGLQKEHNREQNRIKDKISHMRAQNAAGRKELPLAQQDAATVTKAPKAFQATFAGKTYDKMKDAGAVIIATGRSMLEGSQTSALLGDTAGFTIHLDKAETFTNPNAMVLRIEGARTSEIEIPDITAADPTGIAMKISNRIGNIANEPDILSHSIAFNEQQIEALEKQIKPFEQAAELEKVQNRHKQVIDELKPKDVTSETPETKASIGQNTSGAKLTTDSLLKELQSGSTGRFINNLIESGRVVVGPSLESAPHMAQAWTDKDGTMHLIADRINKGDAQAVLLHEVFHSGVRPLLGDAKWQQLMRDLSSLYRQFSQSKGKARQFFDAARQRTQQATNQTGTMSKLLAAEEFGAYAIEEYSRAPGAIRRWVDNLIGRVKAWVYQRFGRQLGQLTPAQLRALAIAALKQQSMPLNESKIRFSVGKNQFIEAAQVKRQAETFNQARSAAKAFQGMVLTNRESGLQAVVSRNTLDKMLQRKAVSKSETPALHSLAVANLDQLFERAIYGWGKEDSKEQEKGTAHFKAIHRLFAPLALQDGRVLLAKLTVKETLRSNQSNPLYTVEAVEFHGKPPAVKWVQRQSTDNGKSVYIRPAGDNKNIIDIEANNKSDGTEKKSPAASWVHSAKTNDGLVQTDIRSTGDNSNIARDGYQDNSSAVEQLASEIERHNNALAVDGKKYSIAAKTTVLRDGLTVSRVIENLKGRLTDLQPKVLKTIPLNYFTEIARPNMTAVSDYMHEKRDLDAYRGKKHAEADAIAQRWLKFSRLGKDKVQALSSLMHEATIAGVDPSKTDAEAQSHRDYNRLRKAYHALPESGRKLFQDVRDAYLKQSRELDDIIMKNVERVEQIAQEKADAEFEREKARIDQSTLDQLGKRQALEDIEKAYKIKRQRSIWALKARLLRLRQAFEASRVEGPYFPLARFGQYFVSVKNRDGEVISFSRRERAAERDRLAKEMQREYPGMIIETGVLEQGKSARDAMDPRMISEIEGILGQSALSRRNRHSHGSDLATLFAIDAGSIRAKKIHSPKRYFRF